MALWPTEPWRSRLGVPQAGRGCCSPTVRGQPGLGVAGASLPLQHAFLSFLATSEGRAEKPRSEDPAGWGGAAAGSVGFLLISRKNVWWSHPLVILVFKRMLFGEKRLCFLSNIIPSLESCDIKILPPLSFFLALPHGLFNFTTNYLTKIKGYM